MKAKIFLALAIVAMLLPLGVRSQTPAPAPVVVPVQGATTPAMAETAASADSTLKLLQEMKAANEATLKTQAAQLATLDELQKAAEEIKIFSKRG